MQKLDHRPLLDTHRFAATIARQPEFADALSGKERRTHLRTAIASSALSLAHEAEKTRGEYDLDANLYKMIGQLSTFYESQKTMASLREDFGSIRDMPSHAREIFTASKRKIIAFNHTLHEVINVCASKVSFDELVDFMTYMHRASGGGETSEDFQNQARSAVIGMRNEMAYEQILIAGDIDYTIGDVMQDSTGEDLTAYDTPIDVKASERQARAAREKAIREHRNPDLILWSRVNFKDFGGRLMLPYDKAEELLPLVKSDLARAAASHKRRQHLSHSR